MIYISYSQDSTDEFSREEFSNYIPKNSNVKEVKMNLFNKGNVENFVGSIGSINNNRSVQFNLPLDTLKDYNTELNNKLITYDTIQMLGLKSEYDKNLVKAQNLFNTIRELNNISNDYPTDKPIKTIKSKYNSTYLSVSPDDMGRYNILANDKCLNVKGLCPDGDDYCLLKCQDKLYSSNSQKFYTNRIYSNVDAAKIMGKKIEDIKPEMKYPYNIFRSAVNDKCLTIDNIGISVENCNMNNLKQHWEISPDENKCTLN